MKRILCAFLMLFASICLADPQFGRFAYVANPTDNTISAYSLSIYSGRLRHEGYTTSLFGANSVAATPDSKFLYASNGTTANIQGYAIDSATGRLTSLGTTAAGTAPSSVIMDPLGRFVYLTNNDSNNVSGYAINSGTGALSAIAGSPFSAGTNPRAGIMNTAGTFLYIVNGGGNVSGFSVNGTGVLAALPGSPYTAGAGAEAIAMDPAGAFVYVANKGAATVSVFSVNLDGSLTGAGAASTGTSPEGIAIDPTGKFAYVANGGSDNVSAYSIGIGGALTQLSGSPVTAGDLPASITVDPSGKFVYTTNSNSNDVSIFAIDSSTGALTANAPVRAREGASGITILGGPSYIVHQPKFAFVDHISANQVTSMTINSSNGALAVAAGSPYGAGLFPKDVTSDGRHTYVVNQGDDNISGYLADPTTAVLTPTAPAAFSTDNAPRSITIDLAGQFVYNSTGDSTIRGFLVDSVTGNLAPMGGFIATGLGPFDIEIDPSTRFLYTANSNGNNISAFKIASFGGGLTAVPGQPFAATNAPRALKVDPTGRFLYVGNAGTSNTISIFNINATTGALTAAGSVGSGGFLPSSLAVHPAGWFLYVLNGNSGSVAVFAINQSTGALTEIAGSPFASAPTPSSIDIDPSGKFAYVIRSGDIEIFKIDSSTGALSVAGTATTPAGTFPNHMVVTGVLGFQTPPTSLFFDDFEDGDASDWGFLKGNWSVVNGNLTGTFNKKSDIVSPFSVGCSQCTIEADLQIQTAGARASLLGWYVDKRTNVELVAMNDKNKWLLKHKSNGNTVAKAKFIKTVDLNHDYHVQLSYDGANLTVFLDGVQIMQIATPVVPSGTVGFRVKSTTGVNATASFREITVF